MYKQSLQPNRISVKRVVRIARGSVAAYIAVMLSVAFIVLFNWLAGKHNLPAGPLLKLAVILTGEGMVALPGWVAGIIVSFTSSNEALARKDALITLLLYVLPWMLVASKLTGAVTGTVAAIIINSAAVLAAYGTWYVCHRLWWLRRTKLP